jgi:hypothetical protein
LKFEVGAGIKRNAFTEIINGISQAKFLRNSDHIVVSRDYMYLKLWDIRATNGKPYMNI